MSIVNTETGEIVEPLSVMERSALAHQESAIEQGADQVAKALGAIRDQRLYREEYATFEAYCRERWGMTHRHVNRQIVAAEVAEALGPMGPKVTERQARELADLRDRPDRLRDTYSKAQEATGGKVTAAAIREVRNPTPEPPDEPEFVSARDALTQMESVPAGDNPNEYESTCHVDPSGGVNDLKDLLRGWDRFLANYYRDPSRSQLDVLADWLDKHQRKTTRARSSTP